MATDQIQVLLVEDNPADARMLIESLRESSPEGFSVRHVQRLKEAAAAVAAKVPHVILLDLTLPDVSGLETVRQMQMHASEVPIVVLTGMSDDGIALEAMRCGVQDYLVKGQLAEHVTTRALRYAIERWKVERSLLASEERFRLLVEGVKDYAIFMLDPEGRVTSWNVGAQRISGYSTEEILGKHVECFYPHDGGAADTARRAMETALAEGRMTIEGFRLRKDGSRYWARNSITAVQDGHQKHLGFAHITQDLTEHNKLENQLRQAQKMEAVGQLTGGIAHDFNNLLTIITGYSELLLDRLTPGDSMIESLKAIRDAGNQAASLTQQLLAFSRRTVLEPKVLDLNEIIRDGEKMLRRLLGEDLVLTLVLGRGLRKVKIDPGHLTQVVMNLAVNARDAMPHGGRLTIETASIDLDESYARQRSEVVPGTYVMLMMTDSGCGMSPEVKARIFEPFFTTKEVGKGTGLGLAVVHGIIKQSGGHIEVYSEMEIGTTFKIYLPAADEGVAARDAEGPPGSLTGTETVLLVEDDINLRRLATIALQDCGYTLLQASNGMDALRKLETHTGKIDLLATDVIMPHLGGRELAANLRPRFPNMKVLFMSGYTDDAVVRHGILHSEVAFLQKPYTPNSLRRKVREALDKK